MALARQLRTHTSPINTTPAKLFPCSLRESLTFNFPNNESVTIETKSLPDLKNIDELFGFAVSFEEIGEWDDQHIKMTILQNNKIKPCTDETYKLYKLKTLEVLYGMTSSHELSSVFKDVITAKIAACEKALRLQRLLDSFTNEFKMKLHPKKELSLQIIWFEALLKRVDDELRNLKKFEKNVYFQIQAREIDYTSNLKNVVQDIHKTLKELNHLSNALDEAYEAKVAAYEKYEPTQRKKA